MQLAELHKYLLFACSREVEPLGAMVAYVNHHLHSVEYVSGVGDSMPVELRAKTVEVLRDLIIEGLIQAGDLSSGGLKFNEKSEHE